MKNFILSTFIIFIASCSKTKPVEPQVEVITEKPAIQEVVEKKIVKEELIVEKLTDREKLTMLLGKPSDNKLVKPFQEVTSFLDPYGSTFAYANFEDTKSEYTSSYKRIMGFMSDQVSQDVSEMENLMSFINIVSSLGFWELDALGLSHYKINDDINRNKFCIHKNKTASPGYFWECYGKPEKFNILDLLPEETLFSSGFKVDKVAIFKFSVKCHERKF